MSHASRKPPKHGIPPPEQFLSSPRPAVPPRRAEPRFYAPSSLTLPDWVCGPVTAKLYRLQLDRAAQVRELVSGVPPYREPTLDDLAIIHKSGNSHYIPWLSIPALPLTPVEDWEPLAK